MIEEIIYTSAPQGLKPGSKGFCTVASTPGMASTLATLLESLSGYRHLVEPGTVAGGSNPVVYTHFVARVGGRKLHILSRIGDAGLDYSGRSNKLAHHVVFSSQQLNPAGPAAIQMDPPFHETTWSGEPRLLRKERSLPASGSGPGACRYWQEVTGDAGWGGNCAEGFLKHDAGDLWLIYPPGVDILRLLGESLALLPPAARWEATYTTFFTKLPPSVDCRLRCALEGTPEAQQLRKRFELKVLDLCRPLGSAPHSEWTEAARSGRVPQLKPLPEHAMVQEEVEVSLPDEDDTPYEIDLAGFEDSSPPPLPGEKLPTLRAISTRSHSRHSGTTGRPQAWVLASVAMLMISLLIGVGAVTWKFVIRSPDPQAKSARTPQPTSVDAEDKFDSPEQSTPSELKAEAKQAQSADNQEEAQRKQNHNGTILVKQPPQPPQQEPKQTDSAANDGNASNQNESKGQNTSRDNDEINAVGGPTAVAIGEDADPVRALQPFPSDTYLVSISKADSSKLRFAPIRVRTNAGWFFTDATVFVQVYYPKTGDPRDTLKYEKASRGFLQGPKDAKFAELKLTGGSPEIAFPNNANHRAMDILQYSIFQMTYSDPQNHTTWHCNIEFRKGVELESLPNSSAATHFLDEKHWEVKSDIADLNKSVPLRLRAFSAIDGGPLPEITLSGDWTDIANTLVISQLPVGDRFLQLRLSARILPSQISKCCCRAELFLSEDLTVIPFDRLRGWSQQMQNLSHHFSTPQEVIPVSMVGAHDFLKGLPENSKLKVSEAGLKLNEIHKEFREIPIDLDAEKLQDWLHQIVCHYQLFYEVATDTLEESMQHARTIEAILYGSTRPEDLKTREADP